MTMVPVMSASSIARRMASTAARSAPSRSPRPMRRAAAIAPASVAATASTLISLSRVVLLEDAIGVRSMAEVPATGEDHGHVVTIGHFDRHLVADAAARLDDRRHPGLRRDLDPVREGKIGI